jgi:hypothetical protein
VAVLPLLSEYRDVEELLFVRGVIMSYEAIRKWCRKFAAPRSAVMEWVENPLACPQQAMSPSGVAAAGCNAEVQQLPVQGTGAVRCRPPRCRAWRREYMLRLLGQPRRYNSRRDLHAWAVSSGNRLVSLALDAAVGQACYRGRLKQAVHGKFYL